MLRRPVFAFINRLLAAEGWAQARLKPFAGQRARLVFGPFAQTLAVAGDGSLAPCADDAAAAVTIRLPGDAPFRLLGDRDALFASAHVSGAADFSEALGFVVRNLRWDVEADLAGVVGDIAAHRMAAAGRALFAAGGERTQRLGANVGEYLVEEARLLVRRDEATGFGSELAALDDALARLEGRLARLEKF
ncbi:MAG: hypothetical protein RBT86_03330 [Azospira sp.]|jgi:ubiquinone biosynthesis protein UbiJ|nr:hypothetical protein [Azospira sp.]